jgi:NADH dehydrogenase
MGKLFAITGANGFIGKALVEALHNKGHRIKALVHHEPTEKIEGVEYIHYSLEQLPSITIFTGVDVLIHLAFEFKQTIIDGEDVNIRAIKALKALNIPSYIFMSSFAAANPVTPSYYGLCKLQAESFFANDLIIQPGLVLGNAGLFGRMKKQLEQSRFVPLLSGGKQIIQTIFINNLVSAILTLHEEEAKGIYPLAHPDKIVYKELLQEISKQINRPITFIPLPLGLMKLMIAAMQLLPKPPFNKDNLTGLLASKYVDTTKEFKQMGGSWLSPREAIKRLI